MSDYTIQAMLHLVRNEFTTPEREHKLGVMVRIDFRRAETAIFLLLYI